MATKVVTGEVRLSYVNLLEPREDLNGNLKYSCVILIDKNDKDTLSKIRAAQKEALENGKASKFNGKVPAKPKLTLRDGDEEGDLEKNPEYEGHWFMNVNSTNKPGIVDKALNPVMEADQVYSGVYARVSINAFPFSAQGNKGVSFGLNNVMVLGKGDRLAGGASAEEDFADFAEDADELL